MTIFVVKPRAEGGKARLIKADRRSQVESFILGDFNIERVKPEEAAILGAEGVKIEDTAA